MTRSMGYPSDEFPRHPAVTIEVPDDWEPILSPSILIAAGAPEVAGVFRENVVVTSTRFPGGFTLSDAVDFIVGRFALLEGLAEIGRESIEVLGSAGFHYEASYTDERVGALVQALHLTVLDAGPFVDLVQVTATCTGEQALENLPQLRQILAGAKRGAQ